MNDKKEEKFYHKKPSTDDVALFNYLDECAIVNTTLDDALSELKISSDICQAYREATHEQLAEIVLLKTNIPLGDYYNGLLAKHRRHIARMEYDAYTDEKSSVRGKNWFKYHMSSLAPKQEATDIAISKTQSDYIYSQDPEVLKQATQQVLRGE
jgi:hypothetical protein